MDRKKKLLLVSVLVVGCMIAAIGISKWHSLTKSIAGEEQNKVLLGIRNENDNLFQEVTPAPTIMVMPNPLPDKEPTRQVYEEEPIELTPLEVVEQNKNAFDDLVRLIKYGMEPAKSKWEILDELRPYLTDDCYQFYVDYFLHLDLDTELPDYWPTEAGVYVYVYGEDGMVMDIVTVDAFVEQYGYYPEQWDIIVLEGEKDPQTVRVTYEQSDEEQVISVFMQDEVRGERDYMYIYFEPGGRVWYFY